MTKKKISATVDSDRLVAAVGLVGSDNVSAVLNRALEALIIQEREKAWLSAHEAGDLPGEVKPDLSDVPWED